MAMGKKFSGLILKTAYASMGETSVVEILGKSMLDWVKKSLGDAPVDVADYDEKAELLSLVRPHVKFDCDYIVVLFSDTPLITAKTVRAAVDEAYNSGKTVLKMTRGYVFSCSYVMNAPRIYTNDTFYFDEEDFITAFNFKQVGLITDVLRNRILDYHMENGVYFEDLHGTFIGCDVVIERGVTIGHGNVIKGRTVIKSGARILGDNSIEDCIIDEGASIDSSHAVKSYIGKRVTVGPYANLRAGNVIEEDAKIGDFVELKNCHVGARTKMSHLTYGGDLDIAEDCNVGAGVVFANYDGKNKSRTTVGRRVFIGSQSTLIAPVTVGEGAFIAGGSTITESVPEGALAVARGRQVVKRDWDKNQYVKKFDEKK